MTGKLNIMLIGGGGREHALALKFLESPILGKLYASPGNPGIAQCAQCLDLDLTNHQTLIDFCHQNAIDFIMVGPEAPLVTGVTDALRRENFRVFGPSAAAASLEGSKDFTKELCRKATIPTANSKTFEELQEALAYVKSRGTPLVVKADGLAAGKGVTVADRLSEAETALHLLYAIDPAAKVVIEDKLEGEEISFFALCAGTRALFFGVAQDHKRVGEGETGANTGGMGAYSPVPLLTPALRDKIMDRFIYPTLREMSRRGSPFCGILFAGLMLTKSGPSLIEFNVRLGDPETQVLLPLLNEDLLTLFYEAAQGYLPNRDLNFSSQKALTIVLAASPYPEAPKLGGRITGLNKIDDPHIIVTHAGTKIDDERLVANGGRVLNVTAVEKTFALARQAAYTALAQIEFSDGLYRRDIGWRLLD